MRESYKEDLANHFGLELYADGGNDMGVATTEVYAGKLLSSEITNTECRHCVCCGKAKRSIALLASDGMTRRSRRTLSMRRNFNRENREIPEISRQPSGCWERSENAYGGTAGMVVSGKSDDFVVPTKWANKAGTPVAESMEGRRSPKSS